jgi:hypothetical protein
MKTNHKRKPSNKNKTVRRHKSSNSEDQMVRDELVPSDLEKISIDYQKLQELGCKKIAHLSAYTRVGNSVVDAFTLGERLYTKGHQNIDFYTFWKHRKEYQKIPYIQKTWKFYKSRKVSDIRKMKYIFNLYFSSISIFKPTVAMEIYCKYRPTSVLDFTMGWGGRLVGACALNIPKYIGVDQNTHLEQGYREMMEFLQTKNKTTTHIELFFQDALTVDYSKLDYDMVLTSPPYYDLEKYRGSKSYSRKSEKTKEEWNRDFYIPLFERTWTNLKPKGHYCLNVPIEIYETVCIPILGKAVEQIPLKKIQRIKSAAKDYKEFIYVWKK